MSIFDIYLQVHNTRSLLNLVLRLIEQNDDSRYDEIRFAIEVAYKELCEAQEGIENLPM